MKEIVLATTNLGKIREFRQLFRPLEQIDLLSLNDFAHYQPPEETGDSFANIAEQKAKDVALALGKWALADDSGLVVPSLGGAPGIYSRRYAGPQATDADNRRKLLDALEDFTHEQRYAYFVCALALAQPNGRCKIFVGQCEGFLTQRERGRNGFGYDALFIKHGYDKTFAELDEATKNRISHRYKAFEKLQLALESANAW